MPESRNMIWLASFPKSGNTWVAAVLESAGCKLGYGDGTYDAYNLQARGQDPIICRGVDPKLFGGPVSIVKTHAPYDPQGLPHRFPGVRPLSSGFVHIFRNPLDVLLSYIAFTRLEYRLHATSEDYQRRLFIELLGLEAPVAYEDWCEMTLEGIPRERLDNALDVFGRGGMVIPTQPVIGSWIEHWRSWRHRAAGLPGVSLRYEDCLADPAQFAPLADMLDLDRERLIKSVGSVNANTARRARSGCRRDRIFFSKRQAGYFREYFSAGAIDRFVVRHGDALVEAGYGSLAEGPA